MGLTDQEHKIVFVLGQTLFPRGKAIQVDADDVGTLAWVDDYLWRMPPSNRNQIRAVLTAFDVGYGAWALSPGARFHNAKREERLAYIESWSESTNYLQRMLFEAVWALLCFGFVERGEARAEFGRGAPLPGFAERLAAQGVPIPGQPPRQHTTKRGPKESQPAWIPRATAEAK